MLARRDGRDAGQVWLDCRVGRFDRRGAGWIGAGWAEFRQTLRRSTWRERLHLGPARWNSNRSARQHPLGRLSARAHRLTRHANCRGRPAQRRQQSGPPGRRMPLGRDARAWGNMFPRVRCAGQPQFPRNSWRHASRRGGRPERMPADQRMRLSEPSRGEPLQRAANRPRLEHHRRGHRDCGATVGQPLERGLFLSPLAPEFGRVADVQPVDRAQIGLVVPVRGVVRFAGAERYPADAPPARPLAAQPEERHQRRRIDRTPDAFGAGAVPSGYPGPAAADLGPAAVMEWREAPGLGAHPGPPPRGNVIPAPFGVWRPASLNRRIPDFPVSRIRLPGSVIVQVIAARHLPDDRRGRRVRPRGRGDWPLAGQHTGQEGIPP